jgi:hypothetical protein
MDDVTDKAVSGAKTVWCTTWTFAQNMGRRTKILGRYSLACWQQYQLKKAMHQLGDEAYQALERGESNPMVAPEVSEAVQKARELKEQKDKNYQEIEAIRGRIKNSCEMPTPDKPGAMEEETPPAP